MDKRTGKKAGRTNQPRSQQDNSAPPAPRAQDPVKKKKPRKNAQSRIKDQTKGSIPGII